MDKGIMYTGVAAAAYFLFLRPAAAPGTATALTPGSMTPSLAASNLAYGINGGYVGGHAAVVSNYAQLTQQYPNLLNPNYQLTAQEANTYANNYSDISQGVATWPGGLSQANLQKHWTMYGCAQQRIFLPLQPPSTAAYVPPPQPPKAASGGGGGFFSSVLSVVGEVASAAIMAGVEPKLNAAECQLVFTSAAIFKDILPMYANLNRPYVNAAALKLDDLLTQYS